MEAYLPPTYYEPRSGFLTFLLAAISFVANVVAAYIAASSAMTKEPRPEVSMTKKEFQELVREAVRGEVARLKERTAARESLLDEAIEIAHVSEVRIAPLEDDYNKAMKEMVALQASISHAPKSSVTAPRSRPASPSAPPSLPEHSSRASSHNHDESDGDSIYGGADYESPPEVSSPPGQAHEVSSPQLDQETFDKLAALAGWGLDRHPMTTETATSLTRMPKVRRTMSTRHQHRPSAPPTSSSRALDDRPSSRCQGARRRVRLLAMSRRGDPQVCLTSYALRF
jgi:hypothetical protein